MRGWLRSEDGWSVLIAFLVVGLGLSGGLAWTPTVSVWSTVSTAIKPGGWHVLYAYLFLLGVLTLGASVIGRSPRSFAVKFSVFFALAYACWLVGHHAWLAATPDQRAKHGLSFSLSLTGEAGYLVALGLGLLIGNALPRTAAWFEEVARTEWYVKTAIIIVGATLGLKAAEEASRAQSILLRGLAAIVEAYLIYWAVVYFLARRVFGFSREWAAPLASGISICGVSAAITTGAAIRARPVVPVMVSSLVVVFSVVELILLPFLARAVLSDQPMVAAAWMGLAVKTDGAAFSSGAITEALILQDAASRGIYYQKEWMFLTTTSIKVCIDLFIGVWAVVLGAVWAYGVEPRTDRGGVPVREIWNRFPKFVFGYFLTFSALLAYAMTHREEAKALKSMAEQMDAFRRIFFVMTFFAIGLSSNLRRLWAEGLGRLALVYTVSLFGFVIWFGLIISWLFFHDVMPPLAPNTP